MATSQSLPESPSVRLQRRLVGFVRHARINGYRVGVAEELEAQVVASRTGIASADHLRWGLRSLLCSNHDDWTRFDDLFDAYWLPGNAASQVSDSVTGSGRSANQGHGQEQGDTGLADSGTGTGDSDDEGTRGGASVQESLERADFGQLANSGQMRAVERLVESLARRMRRRLIRRERVQRDGRRLHLRHTLRASLPYGGMPLRLIHRQRRRRQPRLIIVTDVSRSMSMYSLLFLRFARGILGAFRDADAFACHTRLVPISEALRQPDRRRLAENLALISQGFSGGTRIGASLGTLIDDYGQRLNRRTVLVVISDGLDTGEPDELAHQLARLQQRCRRVVWLNPLLGRPGYELKTGALLAALPHIDLFAPAHNLESLAALEPELAAL